MVHKEVELTREALSEYHCAATFLPIKKWRYVIGFLRMSRAVEQQLRATDGLIRYGLKAEFARKHFYTLSVWRNKESMLDFVHQEPHKTAITKFALWAAKGAAFVEYTSKTGEIDWEEAQNRLREPSFYYKST